MRSESASMRLMLVASPRDLTAVATVLHRRRSGRGGEQCLPPALRRASSRSWLASVPRRRRRATHAADQATARRLPATLLHEPSFRLVHAHRGRLGRSCETSPFG
jgi:hypothetical protein